MSKLALTKQLTNKKQALNLRVLPIKFILMLGVFTLTSSLSVAKPTDDNKKGQHQRPSFESIDLNGDGEVNFEEFSSHEIPHGDHETLFNIIDSDGDGFINNDEFTSHKPPQRKSRSGERYD